MAEQHWTKKLAEWPDRRPMVALEPDIESGIVFIVCAFSGRKILGVPVSTMRHAVYTIDSEWGTMLSDCRNGMGETE